MLARRRWCCGLTSASDGYRASRGHGLYILQTVSLLLTHASRHCNVCCTPSQSAHLFAGRILHVQDLPDTADQLADQVGQGV